MGVNEGKRYSQFVTDLRMYGQLSKQFANVNQNQCSTARHAEQLVRLELNLEKQFAEILNEPKRTNVFVTCPKCGAGVTANITEKSKKEIQVVSFEPAEPAAEEVIKP